MRKIRIVSFVAMLFIVSCKKEPATPPTFRPDYFLFGEYSNKYPSNVITGVFYLANNNHLYRENPFTNLYSKNATLPDSNYAIVKPLIDSFPSYLLMHRDTSLGCPDCVYPIAMNIIVVTGTDTAKWIISADTAAQPAEIRAYMRQIVEAWHHIE